MEFMGRTIKEKTPISSLYERTLYINPNIDYLFNAEIIEYDIKRAGLSLITHNSLGLREYVGEKKIKSLLLMDKEPCNVEIGMMQKNHVFAQMLLIAFKEARKMFFEANHITDNDILAIRKDAIFLINKRCTNCVFDTIDFREKNRYYGYLKLNKVEFYYTDENTDIDVKGIDDNKIINHKDYMIDFIKDIFILATKNNYIGSIHLLTEFINAYRRKDLSVNYYRELNQDGLFAIRDNETNKIFHMDGVEDYEIDNVDISYNYFNYLIPLTCIFI